MLETRKYIFAHHEAPYEVAQERSEDFAGMNFRVRLRRHETPEELLARTLLPAIRAKTDKPLREWLKYFMRTEP